MYLYCTGIKRNGERILVEAWLLHAYRRGEVTDPFLLADLDACVRFYSTHGELL